MPERTRHPDALPAELAGESRALSELLLELASAPERDLDGMGAAFAPGQRVGRFELLREVGRGGFGVVFEARDTELGRLVAFKAMRPSRAAASALEKPLREEAEAAARLNHPNVVTLHDYGLHEGTPYLILELLRGETLQQRLRRGPLPPLDAIRLAADVARGLAHAHARGVLHRDLKPGNVFLCAGGGVKLLDFGLARLLDRASLAGGTPAYMAPEQLRGEPGDARVDVFSAAVVLFQTLAGELPFPVVDGRTTVVDPGPPPPVPIDDPPPELAALLAGALSKDPAGRPQTADHLVTALEGVERAYAQRAAADAAAQRRRRLRRLAAASSVLALAVAIAAAGLALRSRADAERALRAARIAAAAEGASDPLTAALLMIELGDDPPPRALEVAQRVLAEAIPAAAVEVPSGGLGVDVSPDGTRVAVGLPTGGAMVLAADGSGDPRAIGTGGWRTNAVAFTPEGDRIVTAGQDGDVHVSRAQGEPSTVVIHAGDSPLSALAVAPDGLRAAAGGLDGRAWLVALGGARPPQPLLHDGAVFSVAYAPDGARLATGAADGYVRVFDARTGALLARAPVPGGAVFAVAWSPDGGAIAAACEDGVARVLAPDGAQRSAFGHAGAQPLASVAWSPDGKRLAAASQDGSAYVYALSGRGSEVRLRGHVGTVRTARFSPDGKRVLTASIDGTVRLWPADGDGDPVVLRGAASYDAVFSPDGARIVTRGKDSVRVWRAADPRARGVLRGHADLADTVEWTRDGTRLVSASHDGSVRVWPVRSGGAPLVLHDPGGGIHGADLSPSERELVTPSYDGAIRVWDAGDGRLLRELRGHRAGVLAAVFSPDGRWVASGSLDRSVRIWPADGSGPSRVLGEHGPGVTSVAWTPDGRAIVSSSQLDATVRIWPVDGGPPRIVRVERGVLRASVTRDGTRLLVPEENGPLHVFDLRTLAELPSVGGLPERLYSAAASADGRRIALGAQDGTIRVVPADGDGEPLVLRGDEAGVVHEAFSPDGAELATALHDGTVRIWPVSWDRVLALLRGSTTACLGVAHRQQILGEGADEAQRRVGECQRRAGRTWPPVAPAAPAPVSAASSAPAPAGG